MPAPTVALAVRRGPLLSLLALFVAWKLLLLVLVLLTPSPGYDSSPALLFAGYGLHTTSPADLTSRYDAQLPLREVPSASGHVAIAFAGLRNPQLGLLLQKLTSWDVVYFASIAERKHYALEQEWAFGWGFTTLLASLATSIPLTTRRLYNVILHGFLVANTSHLLSVLVLHRLALFLPWPGLPERRQADFAFVAAALHILAPAGIFLFAPCTEAPFSLLNFAGLLSYVSSHPKAGSRHGVRHDSLLLLSGLLFGLATTIRGNGLLSGLIPLYDAAVWAVLQAERLRLLPFRPPAWLRDEARHLSSRRVPATIVAGLLVAAGFAGPQYLAWREYCAAPGREPRPWCGRIPPSIFSWVQEHYWNVGPFRYWTPSNLPLFLLAAPALYLLIHSSLLALSPSSPEILRTPLLPPKPPSSTTPLYASQIEPTTPPHAPQIEPTTPTSSHPTAPTAQLLKRLALPQLALAISTLLSFHVQIITRLSSGYPLWYLSLAAAITASPTSPGIRETERAPPKTDELGRVMGRRTVEAAVRWMVVYALVQAVLFAAFLPPA